MFSDEPLERRLWKVAEDRATISYGALARDLGVRIADLTARLESLMEVDARHGRPFRAALCAGKLSNGLPAKGFFDKLEQLGIVVDEPAAFVDQTRHRMYSEAR